MVDLNDNCRCYGPATMADVLFVCLHNDGRSQMSRALFARGAGERHAARDAR